MTLSIVVFQVHIIPTYITLEHKSIRYTHHTIHTMYLQTIYHHHAIKINAIKNNGISRSHHSHLYYT